MTDGHPTRKEWLEKRRWQESQRIKFQKNNVKRRKKWQLFSIAIHGFYFLIKLIGLAKRGQRNARSPRLLPLELTFPDLPSEFEGYRILHITDPHFDAMPGMEEELIKLVKGQEFDLCAFTGDYRAGFSGPATEALEQMKALVSSIEAKDGVLAILGNHDSVDFVPRLEAMGCRVLGNETISIKRQDVEFLVTGLDDVHQYYSDQALAAVEQCPDAGFKLILVHSAELYSEAANNGFDLYLCGHSHGGQICLPGAQPIITHQLTARSFARGLWRVGSMVGYTSHGAGISGIPIRFNCPPEIVEITLRKG